MHTSDHVPSLPFAYSLFSADPRASCETYLHRRLTPGARWICALAAVLVAFACSGAWAQPSSAASAEADALFDQARQLMEAGKIAEACSAFDASQKLSPAISTLFNQAHCHEQNNGLATAYGLFREAERQTRAPVDESAQKLNRIALDRVRSLESRLSKLTIVVPASSRIAGLEVRRGTAAVEAGAWNRALPVDGGKYTISARAPGYLDWTATIEVSISEDVKTIEVPELVRAPTAAPPKLAHSKRVSILVAGGALVILGTAAGAELWARSDFDKSTREPDDARQDSLWRGAKTKRYAAQGFAVAGLGAAGIAVWLYVRGNQRSAESHTVARFRSLELAPIVNTNNVGLQLLHRY